jgi:hypothetical protein
MAAATPARRSTSVDTSSPVRPGAHHQGSPRQSLSGEARVIADTPTRRRSPHSLRGLDPARSTPSRRPHQTLRAHLITLEGETGVHPLLRLHTAAAGRELHTAADMAAVLDWRLPEPAPTDPASRPARWPARRAPRRPGPVVAFSPHMPHLPAVHHAHPRTHRQPPLPTGRRRRRPAHRVWRET